MTKLAGAAVCALLCVSAARADVAWERVVIKEVGDAGAPARALWRQAARFVYGAAPGDAAPLALPAGEAQAFAGAVSARRQRVDGRRLLALEAAATHRLAVFDASDEARPALLFVERVGVRADQDAERVVRLEGDAIWRWWRASTMVRCDGEARLWRERWDFGAAAWSAATPPPPSGSPLVPTGSGLGLAPAPRAAFRWQAESSDAAARAQGSVDLLAAPRELDDGHAQSAWSAGVGAAAVGEWVAARSGTPRRLVALRILPPPPPASLPRKLVLLVGAGATGRVFEVEAGGAAPLWLHLPPTARTDCVALVVAAPGERGNTALGDVALYTELDRGGAEPATLIADLDAGGAAAAEADSLLAADARAPRALAGALATARPGSEGRRRVLALLARVATPETAPALTQALALAPAGERAPLLAALRRLGPAAVEPLVRLRADAAIADEAKHDALALLADVAAGSDGALALEELLRSCFFEQRHHELTQLLAPVARARPAARQAIIAAAAGGGAGGHLDCRAALAEAALAPPAALLPLLAEARSLGDDSARLAAALPLLRAAAPQLASDSELLAAVRALAQGDASDVLRAAAGATLAGVGDEQDLARLLEDASARVRERALRSWSEWSVASRARARARLGSDAWPQVRAAAVERVAQGCAPSDADTLAALERALDDRALDVRRLALGAIGRCQPGHASIARTVEKSGAPRALREQAAFLLARTGAAGAPPLARTVHALLADPLADEDAGLVLRACLRALALSGDRSQPTLDALGEAAAEVHPPIRAAAVAAIGQLCPAGARRTLLEAERDGDPGVQRAARAALATCRR